MTPAAAPALTGTCPGAQREKFLNPMEQQDTQMASVVPELTDGVIILNAYSNDDVTAHLDE